MPEFGLRTAQSDSVKWPNTAPLATLWPMANTSESTRTTTLKGKPFKLAGPELKPGDTAPDFEAVDGSLQPVNLEKTGKGVRIFSVVPSLDTPVCDAQTKRFEDEAGQMRRCANLHDQHGSAICAKTMVRQLRDQSRSPCSPIIGRVRSGNNTAH